MAQRDKSEPIPIPSRGAGHHAPQMQQNNGVEGDNLPQAVQETTPDAGHRAPQMRENDGVQGDYLPQAVQETTSGACSVLPFVLYPGENKWRKIYISGYFADRLHQLITLISASFQGQLSAVKLSMF